MKVRKVHQKVAWTRAEVEARYERITGQKVADIQLHPGTSGPISSTDLWVWANEALDAKVRAAGKTPSGR